MKRRRRRNKCPQLNPSHPRHPKARQSVETYTLGLSDSDDESDGDSFDWLAGQVRRQPAQLRLHVLAISPGCAAPPSAHVPDAAHQPVAAEEEVYARREACIKKLSELYNLQRGRLRRTLASRRLAYVRERDAIRNQLAKLKAVSLNGNCKGRWVQAESLEPEDAATTACHVPTSRRTCRGLGSTHSPIPTSASIFRSPPPEAKWRGRGP